MKQLVILSLLFTISYCRKKLVTFNDNTDLISTSAVPTSSSMENEIPDDSKLQRLIQKMNQPGREEEFERIASKFIEDMEQIEKDKDTKTDAKKERNKKRMRDENNVAKEKKAEKKDFHLKTKPKHGNFTDKKSNGKKEKKNNEKKEKKNNEKISQLIRRNGNELNQDDTKLKQKKDNENNKTHHRHKHTTKTDNELQQILQTIKKAMKERKKQMKKRRIVKGRLTKADFSSSSTSHKESTLGSEQIRQIVDDQVKKSLKRYMEKIVPVFEKMRDDILQIRNK